MTLTSKEDKDQGAFVHAFGAAEYPRFRMEHPYSPDDGWTLEVAPTGALAGDLPACNLPIRTEINAFFGKQLDELSYRLLGSLPSGRYMMVRSQRTPEITSKVVLGNDSVPAKPNHRTVCNTPTYHVALFGADETRAPTTSGLLISISLLSCTGHDPVNAVWLFDFHGPAAPAVASSELAVVVPLDGPLAMDVMLLFRGDNVRRIREIRERWANEEGPTFVRWLAGEIESIWREFP